MATAPSPPPTSQSSRSATWPSTCPSIPRGPGSWCPSGSSARWSSAARARETKTRERTRGTEEAVEGRLQGKERAGACLRLFTRQCRPATLLPRQQRQGWPWHRRWFISLKRPRGLHPFPQRVPKREPSGCHSQREEVWKSLDPDPSRCRLPGFRIRSPTSFPASKESLRWERY